LGEYQQKLSVANNPNQPQAQGGEPHAIQLPTFSFVSPTTESIVTEIRKQELAGRATAAPAGPTAPAGLASLDFELPTDKNLYELHRFTTPRGEAELTARTISNNMLAKLGLLAGIAAACLLIWAAFWLVRRGVLVWFRRPAGAALLAIAGLVSLCGGLLPVVGLVAMLAGIGLLVAHFWRRRIAAA